MIHVFLLLLFGSVSSAIYTGNQCQTIVDFDISANVSTVSSIESEIDIYLNNNVFVARKPYISLIVTNCVGTAFTAGRCRTALRQLKCLAEYGPFENVSQVTSSPAHCFDVCQFAIDACESYVDSLIKASGVSGVAFLLGLPVSCAALPLTNCIPSRHYSLLDPSYTPTSLWDSGDYSPPPLYIFPALFNSTDMSLCPYPILYGINDEIMTEALKNGDRLRVTDENYETQWGFADCALACPYPEFTQDELDTTAVTMKIVTAMSLICSSIVLFQQLFHLKTSSHRLRLYLFHIASKYCSRATIDAEYEIEMNQHHGRPASIDWQSEVSDVAGSNRQYHPANEGNEFKHTQSSTNFPISIIAVTKRNVFVIAFTISCFVASLSSAIISYSGVYDVVCTEDKLKYNLTAPLCIGCSVMLIWAWNSLVAWAAVITFEIYAKTVLEWSPIKLSRYDMPLQLFAVGLPIIFLIPPASASNLGYDIIYQSGVCMFRFGEDEEYFWSCFACPSALLVLFVAVMLIQLMVKISHITHNVSKHSVSFSAETTGRKNEPVVAERAPKMLKKQYKRFSNISRKIVGYNWKPLIFLTSFSTTIIALLGLYSHIRTIETELYDGMLGYLSCILTEFNSHVKNNGGREAFLPGYLMQIERYHSNGGIAPSIYFDYGPLCGYHASKRASLGVLLAVSVFLSATGIIPYLVYAKANFGLYATVSSIYKRFTSVSGRKIDAAEYSKKTPDSVLFSGSVPPSVYSYEADEKMGDVAVYYGERPL